MADAFEGLGDSERALRSYRSYMAAKSRAEDAGIRRSIANFDMRLKINRMEREHERRSNELVEEIEKRNRELAAIALQLAQKAELIEEMRKKVSYLKNRDGAASADLAKSLLPTINKVVNSGDQWKLFEEQFTRVNPSFLQRLAERFPALTPTEMKICVLLKVNLTSKEIADILCTSVRTVEGHRRLIRKKLELPAETHLGTFLSALT
jgi:DNA-binding CsgD family transcriptional regulator